MENNQLNNTDNEQRQYDWQATENDGQWQLAEYENEENLNLFVSAVAEDDDEKLYATARDDEDEDKDNDETDNEDDDAGDWGHVDPAEGNSPFPDPMDPSGPGSAV